MQVTVEDLNSVKKILHVEIPEGEVKDELDKAYDGIRKTAKIKGFRPGKAPRNVLERLFKKNVHADVSSGLIQNSFIDAIKETELKIVGNPEINPPELMGLGSYKYDATVEVKPEIADLDYKGLSLTKTMYKVSDEEVDAQLKMLQKNLAQQNTIKEDRPIKEDDFALIEYEGFKDGKPFAEIQKTENFVMKIGENRIAKELDTGIIGMMPKDSREIKVKFPEGYYNDKLANTEITFNVTLNEIREEILPEINDDFAKKASRFNILDELKEAIKNNLQKGYEKRTEQDLHEQIYKTIIAEIDFEVPEAMVQFEIDAIITDFERTFAQRNISLEKAGFSKEKLSEKYREIAVKQVKRRLILDKLIDQEELTLSDETLEEGFKDMAETNNQPLEEVKKYFQQNNDQSDLFKRALLERKAIEIVVEHSKVKEVEPTLEVEPEE